MKLLASFFFGSLLVPGSGFAQGTRPFAVGVDHVILGIDDLDRGIAAFTASTGVTPERGGRHPGRGTENALVSLGTDRYLEILAPTTNPPDSSVADLVNHSTLTPAGWALHTGDLEGLVRRLRSAGFAVSDPVPGSRRRPDGAVLQWKTAAATGPGLELAPFFIEWAEGTPHPSITSPGGCGLRGLEVLAPDTTRLAEFFHAAGYRPLLRLAATGGLRLTLSCPRGPVSFSP